MLQQSKPSSVKPGTPPSKSPRQTPDKPKVHPLGGAPAPNKIDLLYHQYLKKHTRPAEGSRKQYESSQITLLSQSLRSNQDSQVKKQVSVMDSTGHEDQKITDTSKC